MDETILNALIGDYRIDERIKAGGMAVVYKATHVVTGETAALKLLQVSWAEHEEVIKRFSREAQIMKELDHPHIVKYYDTGMYQGRPYIVMEHIPGGSLSEQIKSVSRITLRGTGQLLAQMGSALDYAHGKNVIHRDLKPGNILLKNDHHAILTDFGIARVTNLEITQLTMIGQMPGTPHYMSPEQARGELELTQQSDLYSLAVIAFLLSTGSLPFTGSDPLVIINLHLIQNPPLPSSINPDIPKALDTVLLKGMEKDPKDRYQTAAEFVRAFKKAIEGYGNQVVFINTSKSDPLAQPTPNSGIRIFSEQATPVPYEPTFNPVILERSPRPIATPHSPWVTLGLFLIAALVVIGIIIVAGGNGNDDTPSGAVADVSTEETTPEMTPEESAEPSAELTVIAVIGATEEASPTPSATFTATATATATATFTATLTATPTSTATASATPTRTANATGTFIAQRTANAQQTIMAETQIQAGIDTAIAATATAATPTPSATPSSTPTPTLTATLSPIPLDTTRAELIDLFLGSGTASQFDCEQFLNAYNFLNDQLEDNDPEFEPLRPLTEEENAVYRIYDEYCRSDDLNGAINIPFDLYSDMSIELRQVEER